MHLAPSTRVGHYEVLALLGEGGMGEVYRARDTQLGREVALKILPAGFAHDPDRMARFEREAKVLASLNHPNIASIYGMVEQDGLRGIVMELVEGSTLAERIAQGAIPLDEALPVARQIAEALDYAHDRSVIHRDLKPANVKITPEGAVKILDFGLAKLLEDEPATTSLSQNSPTLTIGATRAGVILGTAGYMSPEQVNGKRADRRADIWAFGVVLYEMLTGKTMFQGTTVQEILASVIKDTPKLDSLPSSVRPLVERCLNRDPRRRLQSIGEARIILEDGQASAPSRSRLGIQEFGGKVWITAAFVLLLLALAGLSIVHFRESAPRVDAVRFQIQSPENITLFGPPVLSPDGRVIASTGVTADGRQMIWVRALDSSDGRILPGTEGVGFSNTFSLFWSPDSRFIGFASSGKLRKVEASGGPPQTLCDISFFAGATWNQDGVIVFGQQSGWQRVSQIGGTPAPVTTPDGGADHRFPYFLPDGRHILYAQFSAAGNGEVFVASLEGKEKKRVLSASSGAQFAPAPGGGESGHLLFLRDSTLMAQPFNMATLELTGEAFPIAEQVQSFSVSRNGGLAYRSGATLTGDQLEWFDRSGKPLQAVGPRGLYNDLALSPDAKRVAVTRNDGESADIWIIDVARNISTRFTFDRAQDWDPLWPPDGKRLIFASKRTGPDNIYWHDASGVGKDELLLKSAAGQRPKSVSPDGKTLLFMQNQDLWTVSLDPAQSGGEPKPVPYIQSQFAESQGQFSPVAGAPQWVAYTSNASGQLQIYVQSFPAGAGVFQVSNNGGVQPRWRPDGKELYYMSLDRKLMAVDVKIGPKLEYGVPRELFQTRTRSGGGFQYVFRYAPSADGQRFLLVSEAVENGAQASPPINVVLNWHAGATR